MLKIDTAIKDSNNSEMDDKIKMSLKFCMAVSLPLLNIVKTRDSIRFSKKLQSLKNSETIEILEKKESFHI